MSLLSHQTDRRRAAGGGELDVAVVGLNYEPEPTGIAPYTTGIARGLVAAGHRVRVVTGFPHYPEWRTAPGYQGWRRREEIDGVDVLRVRHTLPADPKGPGRILMETTFGLRACATHLAGADVVVAVTPALLGSALTVARLRASRRPPAVGVVVQDLYSAAAREAAQLTGRTTRMIERVESHLLRSADGVAVIHDHFREPLVDGLGVAPERITTIRNWTHVTAPTVDRALARAEAGWRADETVVLHAGNMGSKQDLGNVVEAARLAADRSMPVRFVLLGDGHERRHLEELAAGVPTLELLPTQPEDVLLRRLVAADVLLVNEGPLVADMCVPSKLTTYFAAGRPVLAATAPHSGTAGELAASGAGVVVPPGDPAALLAGAVGLDAATERADRLGRAGRAYARDVLGETTARQRYDAWVRDLAGAHRPAPARHGAAR